MSGRREGRLVRQGELPVSFSSIDLYKRCPRRWALQKVDGEPTDSGLPAEDGQKIHAWFEARLKGELVSFPFLALAAGISRQKLVDRCEQVVREIQAELLFGGEVLIEEQIDFEHLVGLSDGSAVRVLCRTIPDVAVINKRERTAVVWDYKSGFKQLRPRRGSEEDDDDHGGSTQGLFEALGLYERYGIRQVEFRFELLRWARSIPALYSEADIMDYREQLLAEARTIAEDHEHAPKPGDECRLCPFSLGKCDVGTRYAAGQITLGPQGLENLPPVMLASREDAELVARFTLYADEGVVKKLKAWLNEWTDLNGAAFVGQGAYGHFPRFERSVTDLRELIWMLAGDSAAQHADALIRLLGEAGIDHHTILRPDIKALESYIWGRKRIPGLDRLVVKTPDEYFGFRKNAVED